MRFADPVEFLLLVVVGHGPLFGAVLGFVCVLLALVVRVGGGSPSLATGRAVRLAT